ncbi:MAG: hypothetical protein ACI9WR_001549, partial [Paracoccaceae bacterium]
GFSTALEAQAAMGYSSYCSQFNRAWLFGYVSSSGVAAAY